VITPSVPSLPRKTSRMFGPADARGTDAVRTISPLGSTASSARQRSSMLPYRVENCPAARVATQPPTVERSIDCG